MKPTISMRDPPNRMPAANPWERRLFTLRSACVLLYALALAFPWYRSTGFLGSVSDLQTGWAHGYAVVLPWMLGGLLLSGVWVGRPLPRPARIATGVLGVGLGLAALIAFLLVDVMRGTTDERPAYLLVSVSLLAFVVSALVEAFAGWRRGPGDSGEDVVV
jgi:hypothetical protein